MAVQHEYNAEIKGAVQYFDGNGKMVATYPMIEFKLWCDKKHDDLEPKAVDKVIDANWIELTKEFYEIKQLENYSYPFGGQGIYNVSNN